MKNRLFLLIISVLGYLTAYSQTQQGYVKTLGRPEKKGEALNGVLIRAKGEHNSVLSKEDGTFSILIKGKTNGEAFSLQEVQKKGYELNESGVIGRQYAYSDKVPLTIVMVSSAQLQADKQRIENNAFKVAEKNYKAKLELLEKQKAESVITEEQYRRELVGLQDKFEKYQLLIDGLAEHYAHVDYDELDDKEREINVCIENGELERADSLIKTLFDPIDVLKRNKEALAQLNQQIIEANTIIDKAKEDMTAVVKQQEKDAEHLYQLFTIAISKLEYEQAEQYITIRAGLDTTRYIWQEDAAKYYIKQRMAPQKAIVYYQRCFDNTLNSYFGEHLPNLDEDYENIGECYMGLAQYPKAVECFEEAIRIVKNFWKGDSISDRMAAHRLAYYYMDLGECHRLSHNYQLAITYYSRSMEIMDSINDSIPNLYIDIAEAYKDAEEYNEAIRFLNIGKQKFPEKEYKFFEAIGNIYLATNNYDKAQENYELALSIRKKNGDGDLLLKDIYENLGDLYSKQKKNPQALYWYDKVLDVSTKVYGENNLLSASVGIKQANVYLEIGEKPKAYNIYYKYAKVWLALFSNADIKTTHIRQGATALIAILAKIVDELPSEEPVEKIIELYELIADIQQKLYGENSEQLSEAFCSLGLLHLQVKKADGASLYFEKSLEIQESLNIEKMSVVADMARKIGDEFLDYEYYNYALSFYNRALNIYLKDYRKYHPFIFLSYVDISTCHEVMKDYQNAMFFCQKAMNVAEQIGNPEGIQTVKCIIARLEYLQKLGTPEYEPFTSEIVFTAIVYAEDCPARNQGMDGEYILLEFADWNQNCSESLFDKVNERKGMPKDILVMKDDKIYRFHFVDTIGIELGLKYIDINNKRHINRLYEEWKQQNKE